MKLLKSVLLGITLLAFTTAGNSQIDLSTVSAAPAYLSEENCISIETSVPVQEFYVFSITSLGFASEEEAVKFCNTDLSNLLTLHLDYANSQVFLQLHTDRLPEAKSATWWNDYVGEYCFNH